MRKVAKNSNTMKETTAEDKDRILGWFYEADINGNEVPIESRNLDICAILENDGYIEKGEYRHVLTLKGQSFFHNGGYVKEKEEKEKPIKIAEEANKKARNANLISLLAIVLSIVGFLYTNYIKNALVQSPEEVKTIITDSTSNINSTFEDTVKHINLNYTPKKNQSQNQTPN
jgi:hypothetical protein